MIKNDLDVNIIYVRGWTLMNLKNMKYAEK